MSYETTDQSIQDAQPIELFEFDTGIEIYRYCNTEVDQVVNLQTWTACPVIRTKFEVTSDIFRSSVNIIMDRDVTFPQNYISGAPEYPIDVKIYRVLGSDYQLLWRGAISGFEFDNNNITISCVPVNEKLLAKGLRRRYQKLCPYTLYSERCTVNKFLYRFSGTIGTVSGITVTASFLSGQSNGYYTGGMAQVGIYERLIMKHEGTSIRLSQPFPASVVAGQTLYAFAGCDHTKSVCNSKFNNRVNYGGLPWIPYKNPFSGDAISY